MTAPPIPPPVADPRTPHLDLPLPAPDANAMRTDAARIAASLEGLDAAVAAQSEGIALAQAAAEEAAVLALALGS